MCIFFFYFGANGFIVVGLEVPLLGGEGEHVQSSGRVLVEDLEQGGELGDGLRVVELHVEDDGRLAEELRQWQILVIVRETEGGEVSRRWRRSRLCNSRGGHFRE